MSILFLQSNEVQFLTELTSRESLSIVTAFVYSPLRGRRGLSPALGEDREVRIQPQTWRSQTKAMEIKNSCSHVSPTGNTQRFAPPLGVPSNTPAVSSCRRGWGQGQPPLSHEPTATCTILTLRASPWQAWASMELQLFLSENTASIRKPATHTYLKLFEGNRRLFCLRKRFTVKNGSGHKLFN